MGCMGRSDQEMEGSPVAEASDSPGDSQTPEGDEDGMLLGDLELNDESAEHSESMAELDVARILVDMQVLLLLGHDDVGVGARIDLLVG